MKKILLGTFLLTLSFPSFSEMEMEDSFSGYQNKKTISVGNYVGGGFAGTFIGFGIGHAIQGRYAERGWIFTAGGLSTILGCSGAVFFGIGAGDNPDNTLLYSAFYASLGVCFVGSIIKIWESIDVWWLPSKYKVADFFQLKPIAFYDTNRQFNSGLSLNYQF
ncbi:MAG: hypothetical protein OXC37_04545 [Bdellovibrionaceae bacterium]|nr:hypothetical protein [Pseudobdellovibrionaceae bacterium]